MNAPMEDRKFLEDEEKTFDNSNEETPTNSDYSTVETVSLKRGSNKDRGYAWVVLTASFLCQVVGVGSALSNGAFTPTLLRKYGGDREAVAWIGSIHAGTVFMAGPVAGMLTDRFGHRVVIMCGALLASSGVLLSAFATKIWILYITYGIMGGVGICFTYIPSVTVLANYFDRWRHVAFAASAAGTGIGTLLMPQFVQVLLNHYGLQSAYILTAAVLLQMVVYGALIRPQTIQHTETGEPTHKISLKQELSILTDWRFDLFVMNNYLFNFGSLIIFVFISDYAVVRGTTSGQGMSLISIVGISNAVGRVFNTLLSLCKIVNRTPIYIISCSLSGVSICLLTVSSAHSPFPLLVTFCALYGVLFGVQLGNLAIVTNRLAGVERLNTAYGLVMLLNGAGAATGPPCAGFLYKISGSYELAFYVGGGATILAGLIMIPIMFIKKKSLQPLNQSIVAAQPSVDGNIGGLTVPDIQNMGSRIIASLSRLNETDSEYDKREMKELCSDA